MLSLWYWLRRRTPSSFQPVILVTGCSTGIGLALSQMLYAQKNYRVIVTARSPDSLRARFEESDRFWIRSLDVTSEEQRVKLIEEISAAWGGVNVLINNAGISYRAVVEHMTGEHEFRQMATNYLGPVGLIRLVLPHMRQLGRGKIINVSSVSGMLAMPTMASYTASKYALEGLSEALWYETKPLGINVTLIQPGFVRSKAFERVYYTEQSKQAKQENQTYGDYYSNMAPFIERFMKISLSDSGSIAKLILKVIKTENPPLWIPATLDAYIFYYLRRFVPRRLLLPVLFYLLPRARRWGRLYTRKRSAHKIKLRIF